MSFVVQTLAEKLAWDLSTEYKFDLVSINPSFMLGPAVSAYGTSNSIMEMKVNTWASLHAFSAGLQSCIAIES